MHKVIYRNIRPNLAIDFFPISPAYKKLLNDEKAKGNLLEESTTILENETVERFVLLWKSIDDVIKFNSNPVIINYYKAKLAYNREHEIVTNVIGETYDE